MSNKIEIELNTEGVRELLRSPQMQAMTDEIAQNALAQLGKGYAIDSHKGPNRVNSMVYAETKAARKENLKKNTILKAVRRGARSND